MTTTTVATTPRPNVTVRPGPTGRVVFVRKDDGALLALVPLALHRDETIRQADVLLRDGEREPFLAGLEALVAS